MWTQNIILFFNNTKFLYLPLCWYLVTSFGSFWIKRVCFTRKHEKKLSLYVVELLFGSIPQLWDICYQLCFSAGNHWLSEWSALSLHQSKAGAGRQSYGPGRQSYTAGGSYWLCTTNTMSHQHTDIDTATRQGTNLAKINSYKLENWTFFGDLLSLWLVDASPAGSWRPNSSYGGSQSSVGCRWKIQQNRIKSIKKNYQTVTKN